ncbi:hypothetical protein DY000_02011188 [Brassica cretica]|uniref:Defensin-like domain-containing protein n=1 Tax=Brassica cretica TaxID=69181 RepID=A0ABQ7D941_BRACR|nr:hypothetical protein DY000_02011188 [Brassica cretica]
MKYIINNCVCCVNIRLYQGIIFFFQIGTFAQDEPSSTLCFNPCSDKLGDKECKTICLNKAYKDGSCIGFGIPPTSKYCCCTK